MIIVGELARRVADELVAVQIGDDRWVQLAANDEIAQLGKTGREDREELAKRLRLDFEIGDTGTFPWNTEEFDVHAGL